MKKTIILLCTLFYCTLSIVANEPTGLGDEKDKVAALSHGSNFAKKSSILFDNKYYLQDSLMIYNGYSYDHYKDIYERAAYRKKGGIIMTAIGAAGVGASFIIRNTNDYQTANVTFITGLVFLEIGIPIWIANGIVAKNNKTAMEKARQNTSLSFSTTENGVGLVMRF